MVIKLTCLVLALPGDGGEVIASPVEECVILRVADLPQPGGHKVVVEGVKTEAGAAGGAPATVHQGRGWGCHQEGLGHAGAVGKLSLWSEVVGGYGGGGHTEGRPGRRQAEI